MFFMTPVGVNRKKTSSATPNTKKKEQEKAKTLAKQCIQST